MAALVTRWRPRLRAMLRGATAALVVACQPAEVLETPDMESVRSLTIVAMNDFHGALYESIDSSDTAKAWGGLPWVVGAVEALRRESPGLLLLDGGDVFQGSWPVNQTRGRAAVEAFHLMGVDAAAVGNHEFDYGAGMPGSHPLRGALEEAGTAAEFAWLSANIFERDGSVWQPPGFARWQMLQSAGVRVAVIGLTTAETPTVTQPEHVADLRFADPVEVVRQLLPEVRAQSPDVVVVLGHLTGSCAPKAFLDPGVPCLPDGEIGRLLTELPVGSVDVMVLGHAHTLLAHRWEQTILLQQRAHGAVLGRVELSVGPDGVDLEASKIHAPWGLSHVPTRPGCDGGEFDLQSQPLGGIVVSPSSAAVTLQERFEEEVGSLCEPVGCVSGSIPRDRQAESPLGNLVADAMLSAFPDAEVAVQNSGGLRADLPAGSIRREQVRAVLPFQNSAVQVEMTGRALRTLLRIGSSGAHGIVQVAGARYGFDPEQEGGSDLDGDGRVANWERNRLCHVEVGGQRVQDEQVVQVVTNSFLLQGGDHLGPAFREARVVAEGDDLAVVFERWLARQEGCIDAADRAKAHRVIVGPCQ